MRAFNFDMDYSPVDNKVLAGRRYIACQVASRFGAELIANIENIEGFVLANLNREIALSEDGKIALLGLAKELDENGLGIDKGIPGFRGNDEIYYVKKIRKS